MQIYDYECRGCGKQFEFLLLKTTVAKCPACGSLDLEQLLSTRISISTAASRKSNMEKAQHALNNSDYVRDKHISDINEFKEHAPQMLRTTKKKKR